MTRNAFDGPYDAQRSRRSQTRNAFAERMTRNAVAERMTRNAVAGA